MARKNPNGVLSKSEKSRITLSKAGPDVQYLVVHAVDPVGPQEVDGLADQVGASAVEHPKTQIEMELVRGGFGVETLEGAEAAFRPDDDNTRQKETHQTLVSAGGSCRLDICVS